MEPIKLPQIISMDIVPHGLDFVPHVPIVFDAGMPEMKGPQGWIGHVGRRHKPITLRGVRFHNAPEDVGMPLRIRIDHAEQF